MRTRNIFKTLILLVVCFTMVAHVKAQCVISVTPGTNVSINCGQSIQLEAFGLSSSPALSTDFNNLQLGAGWSTTAILQYDNPCSPSLDGTPSVWYGNVPLPRTLETNAFDVSCGGEICFDLDFGADDVNANNSCEDPDLPNEGVFIQYSTDGGINWIDIFYFQPTPDKSGPYYDWANYCFTIPPGAWSPGTNFRWFQAAATNVVFDHWGIDNVVITPAVCGGIYDWSHIAGTNDPATTTVAPTSTTDYTVTYSDSLGNTCTETITVNVLGLENPGQDSTITVCDVDGAVNLFSVLGGAPDAGGTWIDVNGSGALIGSFVHPTTAGAGVYNFDYIVSGLCNTDTATVTVNVEGTAYAGIDGSISLCSGVTPTQAELFAALGGNPDVGGVWSGPVMGVYTYTVSTSGACPSNDMADVVVTEFPFDIEVTATPIDCHGDSTTISVVANAGTAPITGLGTFIELAGTYNYTVTDANGCTTTESITITQPDPLVVSAILDTLTCTSGTTTTLVVTATGGVGPYIGTGAFNEGIGVYTYVVEDANKCEDSTVVTVTEPPSSPVILSFSSTPIDCNGGTSVVTVGATGGAAPYTGIGNFTVTVGTHVFIVTDANGCSFTDSVTVTEPSPVIASGMVTSVPCTIAGTGTVAISATGGNTPYTGTGSFIVGVGTHTYVVTDANGCTDSVTLTVATPANPVTISLSTTPIACNGGTGDVTVSATGGAAPYTGTGTFTVSPGTYFYTVVDANGCSSADSIVVTQPTQLLPSATSTSILCNGGTADVTVTATGGTSPYTGTGTFTVTAGTHDFPVTDANGCTEIVSITVTEPAPLVVLTSADSLPCNGQGTVLVVVSATGGTWPYIGTGLFNETAGTYTYVITDVNGCTSSAIVNVVPISSPINVTLTSTLIDCNGGTADITVSASGGDAPYVGTGTFTVTAGTYSYTVTDANTCSTTESITVTEPSAVVASASATTIACNGGTADVTVTATGGTAPYTGTETFTVTAGTYTYVVVDANGCTGSVSITVTEPRLMVVSDSTTTIDCFGGTADVIITATAGTAPYTGTGTFSVTAGTHDFTVTDANGCSEIVTITVTEPTQLIASASSTSIGCIGVTADITVTATGGTAPYTGTGTFTESAGTYTYIVVDANGCTDTVSITVSGSSAVVASISATSIDCNGGTADITVTATGGTAPYTGTGSFTETAGTYTYVVTDDNGCTDTVSITITEPTLLVASVSSTSIDCSGGTADVTVTATGGTAPYTGTGTFPVSAGTYDYTVTDANGCSEIVSITVTEPTALSLSISATSIDCFGGTADVTVTATGGTASYTGTGTFTETAGTYTYIVTDANGCSDSISITLTEPASLVASVSSTTIDCNGGTADVTVTATGGTAPYTGTGTFPVTAGTYDYTVTDANGCSEIVSITVTEPTALSLSISATSIDCFGGTADVTVTATGGTASYTGTGTFTETAGTYTYIVTDANGCSDSISITLTEPAELVASVSSTLIDCNGGTADVTVTATGGTGTYTGTGTFNVTAGTYEYIVTDANGCMDTVSITVTEPAPLVASVSAPTTGPCFGANEAVNGDFQTYTGSITQGNSWINNNLDNWSVAHGTPSANGNLAMWMWSYSGYGEGMYTNYNFVSGQEYQITYDLYQATDANPSADFLVRLNNNLTPASGGNTVPSTAGTQLVSDVAWSLSGVTQTITETFIAGSNYSQLWFYPYLTGSPTPNQASCTIDNIVIEQVVPCPSNGILCNGGTTDVTVTATGGSAPYTGTGTFTVTAGTYDYTVTDANNCTEIVTVTVTEPTLLVASASSTTIDCNGGTADVTVIATGGTAPYTGTGTFSVTAGTYTYIVTDDNGCTDTISITVTEPTLLVASASSTTIDCNGGTADVTVIATGGTAPYTGTGTFPVTAGTYTYIVTDDNGCTDTISITVTEPASLLASVSSTTIDCNGGTADVTVSATGGTGPYTGTGTFPVTAGTYDYTVTDANGCTEIVSITVTEPASLVASVSSTSIDCNGGTADVTVSATGGSAPYTGTGTFTVTAGTYDYTVTDANNCTEIVTVTVTEPTLLVASASSTTIDCNGGTADVTVIATGGTAPYTGTGTFSVTAGTYTYIVTDDNGCTDTISITVTEPASLLASVSSTTIDCNGGTADVTVSATGGTGPYTGTGTFPVTAGTYDYTVTDANGCTEIVSITVTEPASLVASVSSTSIDCNGGTADVTVTATGGTAPYTGTGTFPVTAGTYDYTVTDDNGCTDTISITVTEPASLLASVSSTTIDCNGGTADVTVSATGGTGPYTGTGTFPVTAGTYDYTVTDANGCSEIVSITVTEPTALSLSISATSIDCFGGAADVTVTATGGTASYTGTGTFTETAGTYTYIVTDANGCSDSISITLTEPASLVASVSSTTIDCNGGTADVTVTATGGTAPYTGTGTFPVTAGTYDYTVTDANGCSEIVSITVTEPTALSLSISATSIDCNGGTADVTVTATGGTAPYTGTGTFPVTAGTYDYTVTDANGCSETITITVTEPTLLVASVSSTTIPCSTGTSDITVTATGGTAPYSGTGTFSEVAGTYTYIVTDANGCMDTVSITVSGTAAVIASVSSTTIDCNGGTADVTVTATGGTAPYTGTGTFTVLAGTYDYTVTDANGCSETVSITVTEPAVLMASTYWDSIPCNGGTTDLTVGAAGGTAPYTGTGTFVVGAGMYSYTVTDANGCSVVVTANVNEPAPIVVSIASTTIDCNGGTADVTVTATGGTAPYIGTGTFSVTSGTYTYTVTDASGCDETVTITVTEPTALSASISATSIDCSGTADVTVTATGGTAPYSGTGTFTVTAGTYTYTVTDANGCSETVTITVTESTTLAMTATSTGIDCNGGTADITVTASGGIAPYTGTGTFSVTAGTYTYTVADANGCSVSETVTVTEPTVMTAFASCPAILCNGGTTDLAVTAFGGTPPYTGNGVFSVTAGTYTYIITDANGCTASVTHTVTEPAPIVVTITSTGIDCNGGTADLTVTASGGTAPYSGEGTFNVSAGTYSYTITDANGCTVTETITVVEPAALVASASAGTILCNGGSADVTVSAIGGTAPYTGTGTFSETAGTYTYTVTDANGCTATTSVTLTEPSAIVASISATSIDCNGGTADVTVTATGGTAPYTGTGTFSVTAGTYDYTVTDANGCTEIVSITVTEPAAIIVSATAGSILCNGGTTDVTVTATGGDAPYTGTGTFSNLSAGTYTYTVTDANGCSQTVSITVTEPAPLTASISSAGIPCFGGTADITVTASGGTAPYTGTGVYNVGVGTYFYTVTDANGCSVVTDSITIVEPSLMTAYISCPVLTCNGETADIAVFAFGGTAPYTGGGLFNVGAGSYTYVITDANGCSSTVSYTVTEPAPIIVTVTATGTPCAGCTDVTVTASGGAAPYTGLGTFTLTSPGVYSYTVTDASGCTGTGSILVGGGGGGLDGMQTTIGATGKDSEFNMREATISQYPNPASTSATFEFTVPVKEMVTLSIVNLRGELIGTIFSEEIEADEPRLVTHDISELQSGIYFIHMNTDEGTIKKKFVVLK